MIEKDYVIRVHDQPSLLDAQAWNALLDTQAAPTPFLRHEYLTALHESGSATPETGWTPQFLTLEVGGQLQAATALYLKTHSYGEYVFDWAWADAYRRHGLRYYPKLLGAVPFTPVPGTRLLARDAASRSTLVTAMGQLARQGQFSSAHALFLDEADRAAFEEAGWMIRHGVQFHWTQDTQHPIASFSDLLSRLQRDKRKKIQQERRRVPALPQGPFLRRIRLRLGLGRRLPPPRPALLPQAAGRRALHARARHATLGAQCGLARAAGGGHLTRGARGQVVLSPHAVSRRR